MYVKGNTPISWLPSEQIVLISYKIKKMYMVLIFMYSLHAIVDSG